jgi:hypothetical protein
VDREEVSTQALRFHEMNAIFSELQTLTVVPDIMDLPMFLSVQVLLIDKSLYVQIHKEPQPPVSLISQDVSQSLLLQIQKRATAQISESVCEFDKMLVHSEIRCVWK